MGGALPLALLVIGPIAGVASSVGCRWLRAFALRRHLLDRPNERSLHVAPVPRLGGVAIAVTAWLACAAMIGAVHTTAMVAWLAASLGVALLGLTDDVRPLTAGVRLVLQLLAAAAFWIASGAPRVVLLAPSFAIALPYAAALALWSVWLVGVLNIFNFMDGMDGLAGTQAVTAGLAIAAAGWQAGRMELAVLGVAIAGASAGFLAHNAPPATIFMGDAGSTFLGFSFAGVAVIASTGAAPMTATVAPLALAPFLLDGTFTLVRRASRGEAVWRAHRSHLYQRAVQTGLSHRQVLGPYLAWCVVSAVGAALAVRSASLVVAAAALNVVILAIVWRWVAARERVKGGPTP